ncbi:MAG: DNA polymerase I, partial [Candidatus Competibacteraceae bacterium]|nr:DNA polymerase I [Candidatus Competibacteraceae bacterium]
DNDNAKGTGSDTAATGPAADMDYQIITEQSAFEHWLLRLQQAELFAFDTETTSLDYMQAELVGLSFSVQAGEAAYVPLTHDYPGAPEQLDRQQVLEALRTLLEDPTKAKLGQNLKYDWHVLHNHGVNLAGIQHDTMLQSYVLNSTASRHDMDSLARHYLDVRT